MLLRLSPGDLVESRASLKRQRVHTACRQAQGGSFPVQLPQTVSGGVQSSTSQAETGLQPLTPVSQPQASRRASPQPPVNGSVGGDGTFDSQSATDALTEASSTQQFPLAWRVHTLARERGIATSFHAQRSLLACAIKAGQPERALEVFRGMQAAGMTLKVPVWCQVITALSRPARRGQALTQEAHQLWQELQQSGLPLDAKSLVIGMNACVAAGFTEQAAELLPQLAGRDSSAVRAGHNVLLKAHMRADSTDAAVAAYGAMLKAGMEPDQTSTNTLALSLFRAGRLHEAEQLLASAQEAGFRPDQYTTSMRVQAALAQCNTRGALRAIQAARDTGIAPSMYAYGLVMDALASAGDLASCQKVLDAMASHGVAPNAVVWNAFLKARLASPRDGLEAAGRTLRAMGRAGVVPGPDTVNVLMQAAQQQGSEHVVPTLFKALLDGDLLPDAVSFTCLITAFSSMGRHDDALRAIDLLQRTPMVPMDGRALTASIAALCACGRHKRAETLLKGFMASSGTDLPPVQAFGALIAGYTRAALLERALEAMKDFCRRGGVPDAAMVGNIVPLCLRSGSYRQAVQAVDMLEQAGGSMPDKEPLRQAVLELEAQVRARPRAPVRSEHFERFKFWLGLPNAYYALDSEE